MNPAQHPPEPMELAPGIVHVWQFPLDAPAGQLRDLSETLSADERERARAFRFPVHRNRYIVARGLLRAILARYTGEAPAALAFAYNPFGKPSLAHGGRGVRCNPEPDLAVFRFNISHCDDLFLCAVSRGREVGIDVERVRYDLDVSSLAGPFFSREESDALQRAASPERERLFFRYWTRREAYGKAIGTGLSAPVPNVSPAAAEIGNGLIFNLPLELDYAAALALDGREPVEIQRVSAPGKATTQPRVRASPLRLSS
ncbi:MAG: 4'-phosphopantetheinyl transferase superfamily protein [Verrucomicrobiota bacterium]